MQTPRRLDAATRRQVMARGNLDERTVLNWERGRPVRPSSQARIEDALTDLQRANPHEVLARAG